MTFVHEDPDFPDLLLRVASKRGLAAALIEKDYWVTHCLWALHDVGFDIWFKGGTSLSKGFGLIQRFSEDLDLKIEPGRVRMPAVSSWTSKGTTATTERRAYFRALQDSLAIPSMVPELEEPEGSLRHGRARIRTHYKGLHFESLGLLRPYVLLEVGTARVTPFVLRSLTSFVHEELGNLGQLQEFHDNRPANVRCVHPFVTLIDKLDALRRRTTQPGGDPSDFVRHFEDAARIIRGSAALPPLEDYADALALALDMREKEEIDDLPSSTDAAFALAPGTRADSIRSANDATTILYWGERMTLDEACETIRGWLAREFE